MNDRRFWSALSALLIAALIGAACAAPAQAPATTGEPAPPTAPNRTRAWK